MEPSAAARAADAAGAASRPPGFASQTNALLRKNLIFQKRNRKATIRLIIVPIFLCVLLSVLQRVINNELDKPKYRCGCKCVDVNGTGSCQNVCGVQYSTLDQAGSYPIPNPPKWPALVQVPLPEYRAVQDSSSLFTGLPDASCRKSQSCPASIPFTGANRALSNSVMQNLFTSSPLSNLSDYTSISSLLLGTDVPGTSTGLIEPAFLSDRPIYVLQPQCKSGDSVTVPITIGAVNAQKGTVCLVLPPNKYTVGEAPCHGSFCLAKSLRHCIDWLFLFPIYTGKIHIFSINNYPDSHAIFSIYLLIIIIDFRIPTVMFLFILILMCLFSCLECLFEKDFIFEPQFFF